jgi:hypothetical protein
MLELILMIIFCGKLREVLDAKHRSPLGYQLALVGLWLFVQPFWLGLLCVSLFSLLGSTAEHLILFAYGASVLAGVASSLFVFAVATVAPARPAATAAPGN